MQHQLRLGAQGLSDTSGWTVDLRYDDLNQNHLRAGRKSISASEAAATTIPSSGDPAEVEQYTRSQYLTATGTTSASNSG